MAVDLAIDLRSGDLLFSPVRDFLTVEGEDVVKQRVHTRLMVQRGTWFYDVDNRIGSLLHNLFRMPRFRALNEAELLVREALEGMEDITISAVKVTPDETNERNLHIIVVYSVQGNDPTVFSRSVDLNTGFLGA